MRVMVTSSIGEESVTQLVSEESPQLTMLGVEASHELQDTSADSRTLSFTMGEFPYEN